MLPFIKFKIDCYAKRVCTWRRGGFYTPDFLLIRYDGRTMRKVLILETKGKDYADQPAFVTHRNFVKNDFLCYNNDKFGYKRCLRYVSKPFFGGLRNDFSH